MQEATSHTDPQPQAEPLEPASDRATEQAAASIAGAATPLMDREFIARNQIVERYLSGNLPIKWQQAPKKPWERPELLIGLGAAVLLLAVMLAVISSASSDKSRSIAHLKASIAEQPIEAASTTTTIHLNPSRTGASNTPAVTLGGGPAQLAELHIDMTHSPYRTFRVTIDRVDQGRVAILHNVMKDSNGQLHLAFNTSALGPGIYQFTIDGLSWRGDPEPDAWATIAITH